MVSEQLVDLSRLQFAATALVMSSGAEAHDPSVAYDATPPQRCAGEDNDH